MNQPTVPVQSLTTLLICLASSLILAFILLITVVGPAEFGIDPTGLGKKMGLLALADAQNKEKKSVAECPVGSQAENWRNIVVITVPAGTGLEYKFNMNKNQRLNYAWSSDNEAVYFDFHGEPKDDPSGYFKSYQESTAQQSEGEIIAPFTGTHGWYWENNTSAPINITLKTKGQYIIKGLM